MRGHTHRFPRSLRIHSISHAARLCLLARFAPRPASRSVRRGVMLPFSPCVPLLVPCGVLLIPVFRFASASPFSVSCLLPYGAPSSWTSYRLPPRSSPRFAPSPRRSCRETGRHRLACLPLSCDEGAGVCGLSLGRGLSARLACGAILI